MLDNFAVPHTVPIEVGSKAEVIAKTARPLHCDHIVMSTTATTLNPPTRTEAVNRLSRHTRRIDDMIGVRHPGQPKAGSDIVNAAGLARAPVAP